MGMVTKMNIYGNEMYAANTEELSYETLMGMQPILKRMYELENPKTGYWRYGTWNNGHWMEGEVQIEHRRCSVCQRSLPIDNHNIWYRCPHCSARMIEKGVISNENNNTKSAMWSVDGYNEE